MKLKRANMAFCLSTETKNNFKKALKNREINPVALAGMSSLERRTFLEKYVGKDAAPEVNALFESKLLLRNQKAGYVQWAKKVSGITPTVRKDLMSRIESLNKIVDEKKGDQFLNDLVNKRLGIDVTETETNTIVTLTKQVAEGKKKADKNGKFTSDEERLKLGAQKVMLENYVNDLKLESRKISFREEPLKKIKEFVVAVPGIMKSTLASFDNSFWGRQGIKTLLDVRTAKIWGINFLRSWKDIGKQLFAKGAWWKSGDDAVMDAIKADVYSRPNALNGKYNAGNYGLNVLNEEVFPSAYPEQIPLLGRIFKASEVAFNGGALRLRADLADRMIAIGERNGLNMLDKNDALGMSRLVSSMTGRGNLGKAEVLSKEINAWFFSIKFLKSNFDTLTGHVLDDKVRNNPVARKEAAKSLLTIIASLASILFVAKLLNKDSVEPDPRSTNFGKIKIFGKWTDITGGMGGLVTLASRLIPTLHNGKVSFWTKNSKGDYTDLLAGTYGGQTAMDVFDSFWQGKLSPIAGLARDLWKGEDYSGQPVALATMPEKNLPLSVQNYRQLLTDPDASFPFGSLILDGLGFGVSTSQEPNIKSGLIPEGKKISNTDLINTIMLYAKAAHTDPEGAFNALFKGQRIRKVSGDAVIVERMPLAESQAVKKKNNANNPLMKLDHTIPLELGGTNELSNLKIVTTTQWNSYTRVENVLGKALESGKISKKDAQNLILRFKSGQIKADSILKRFEK